MPTYTVTAYVNVGAYNFHGLKPTDEIAPVDEFTIVASEPVAAAEAMFAVGQKISLDTGGKAYPRDVRSLSTGDLVAVRGEHGVSFFACESVGWREIPEPANRIVPLEGQKRHTSRPARCSQ